jgi:hypothetical protein|tara:strand:- start:53 stop:280 length:228 start_codon:yes stop_codon:yes gene_type:complete
MDAGRMCEEADCCAWGDANWMESECWKCDKTIIPAREHDKDNCRDNRYYNYYSSEEDIGDICFKCLCNLKIKAEE